MITASLRPGDAKRMLQALALVALTMLGLATWRGGAPAWEYAKVRHYQRQCFNYTAPADQVVYEEKPAAAAKLLSNPSDYAPFRWDIWAPANAGGH